MRKTGGGRGGREGRADGRVPVRMLRARSRKWRGEKVLRK